MRTNDHQASLDLDSETASNADEAPTPTAEASLKVDPSIAFADAEHASMVALLEMMVRCRELAAAYRAAHGDHSFDESGRQSPLQVSVGRLVERARSEFGFAGRPVPIDPSAVMERFWPRRYDQSEWAATRTYDPRTVWDYLKATYGRQGRTLALQDAARVLIDKLPIGSVRESPIRQVGGFMVFDTWLIAESRSDGEYRLSCRERSAERLPAFAAALGTFMTWAADLDEVPHQISDDVNSVKTFVYDNGHFRLRDKLQVGAAVLVLYKNKCELKLPLALAEKLNLFFAEFAAERLAHLLKQ